ncbi:MAG: hypothetical protein JWO83_785 [Caulobacteraceae bacterium]|nr:hypothetical protein [Caulobacteraceae bacterium]
MLLTNKGLTGWMLPNVLASAGFVHLASWTWLEPNLRGENVARAGDALVWGFGAFPVLAFSAVANAIWFAFASQERRRNGVVWPVPSIIVVAAIWISVLVVDHFRGLGF